MKIHLYIIDKKGKKELYDPLVEHYIKSCRSWARVEIHEIFGKEIAKAQCSKSAATRASVRRAFATPTSAWSPARTETSPPWWPRADFAKISSID